MKILTLNCNGIRSALSKGLLNIIQSENPELIAFQETKAPKAEIEQEIWLQMGYQVFTCLAEKPGYSGVSILSKQKPLKVKAGFGDGIFLSEGRSLLLEYPNFNFWNLYFPSGTTGEKRQKVKYEFLDEVYDLAGGLKSKKKPLILVGDVNIAHREIDIHNPKGNIKNSGFLPEERAWFSKFLESGFVDFYRDLNLETKDVYSWWSYRAGARANNKGWRIDYILGSKDLRSKAKNAKVVSEPMVSDHACVILEIQFS
jgi:exodeoxyribonuclease-3